MVIHDPQEEEYAERASAESDKFDNRLFWTIGGICVLSLGYFQATDTLAISLTLVVGYSLLFSGLTLQRALLPLACLDRYRTNKQL